MPRAARLIWDPRLRLYMLVPLLINCVLFVVLTSALLSYFWSLYDSGTSLIPEWMRPWVQVFAWLAWLVIGALALIIYGYSFNVITNLIAAPFYGMLSEATQKLVSQSAPPPESLWRMLPRVFSRELSKLVYFLGRGLLVILLMLLISLIPGIQIAAPLVGLAWSSWSMAIQYADYPADNHQLPFYQMRNRLWSRSQSSLGFGSAIMLCSVIPIVNIFAMPIAVVGGTLFWLEELADEPRALASQKR